MQTYEILVRNRAVVGNSKDMTLVRTSIGIDQVHILFDNPEWLGFPITITFAQGDDIVTVPLVVTSVTGSTEWVAESTVTVPYEVIDMVGPIRVTLQGVDSNGNHIITAKGSPLRVEEAGDVVAGTVPADAPSVSQWQQAYADAMDAVSQAASLVSNLQGQLDAMVATATQSIPSYGIASDSSLGMVKVGSGLSIGSDGTLTATGTSGGMTPSELLVLRNLSRLANYSFDSEFDDVGFLVDNATLRPKALPHASESEFGAVKVPSGALTVDDGSLTVLPATGESAGIVMPDGTTVTVSDGVISVPMGTNESHGILRPDGVTITAQDGVLTVTGSNGDGYILQPATAAVLGGVKVDGTTIVVDENGVISINLTNADAEVF